MDSGMTIDQHTARASQKLSSPPGRMLSSFFRSCSMMALQAGRCSSVQSLERLRRRMAAADRAVA